MYFTKEEIKFIKDHCENYLQEVPVQIRYAEAHFMMYPLIVKEINEAHQNCIIANLILLKINKK